jgi:hypothetical protein
MQHSKLVQLLLLQRQPRVLLLLWLLMLLCRTVVHISRTGRVRSSSCRPWVLLSTTSTTTTSSRVAICQQLDQHLPLVQSLLG